MKPLMVAVTSTLSCPGAPAFLEFPLDSPEAVGRLISLVHGRWVEASGEGNDGLELRLEGGLRVFVVRGQ